MKWFLIGLVGVVCSANLARGDAAGLFQQAQDAMQKEDFAGAAKAFDAIITGYPSTPNIDNVRLQAGYAFYRAGDYANAIDRLKKVANPQFHGTALLFTGISQLGSAQKVAESDAAARKTAFELATATFGDLISFIKANPTPDNQDMLEDAIYYRVQTEYSADDYDAAIKDIQQLLTQFPNSLRRPDYNLLLGSFYAAQASNATNAAKPDNNQVMALAKKALDVFSQVSSDPNALVQGNDANLREAQVLLMIAPLGSDPNAGYQKALDQFRLVHRKADMIPIQQARLDALKAQAQQQVLNASAATVNKFGLLIDREEGRLKDLQDAPDPIIQALISIAECYNSMKQGDEARTVLHRLLAIRSTLTPDLQQTVDFQIIYSYVLGGKSDKADAALTAYLAQHPGDKQAQGISYEMAGDLLKLKDYKGALAQAERSLKDFPEGPYVADAVAFKAEALRGLGRLPEAESVIEEYVKANPKSPAANRMLLTKGQADTSEGNLNAALSDYQTVKDNPDAGDLIPIATAAYIQTLQTLGRFDDVIKQSQDFAAKYPEHEALPTVLLAGAMAMEKKNDPGAIAALQDVAKKFPKSPAAPFALLQVVNIYQKDPQKVPELIQAASDFRAAYPEAYPSLLQVADALSAVELKQKKFDQAVTEYQPLLTAPAPEIASSAGNKIGTIWLQAAKAMGAYQSMQQQETKDEALKRLSSAEQAFLGTLKSFPGQLVAVGDAFDGLNKCLLQRRSWGLLKDDGFEDYLGKLTADLTSPEMQPRVELAKAALPFIEKNGTQHYQDAMNRFKQVVDANPNLVLTRQEASRYGEVLILAKDYPKALQVYTGLLNHASPNDQLTLADAYYGLGATYLAQGDLANASLYFTKMTQLSGGAAWHPHIMDARYGLARANEQSSSPDDNAAAKQTYAMLMQSPAAPYDLQAKAMLGYGRLLEKAGNGTTPATPNTIEYATHYYQQVNLLFGPSVPELSAEGLYDAGQAFDKAGDKANAQKSYNDLIAAYATTAPDWAAKAKAALAQ